MDAAYLWHWHGKQVAACCETTLLNQGSSTPVFNLFQPSAFTSGGKHVAEWFETTLHICGIVRASTTNHISTMYIDAGFCRVHAQVHELLDNRVPQTARFCLGMYGKQHAQRGNCNTIPRVSAWENASHSIAFVMYDPVLISLARIATARAWHPRWRLIKLAGHRSTLWSSRGSNGGMTRHIR